MLAIRDHGVDDYTSLRDMDASDVGVIDDTDQACLDDLGHYLVETGKWHRFAIWLLHKHFEPEPSEVFVESVDVAARRTRTTLRDRSDAFTATAVRFEGCSETFGVVGMEFADTADFAGVRPFGDDDRSDLAGIGRLLQLHGKADRFGVRLIRNPLQLTAEEVLLETCDMSGRTLQCRVGTRAEVGADHRLVDTTWQWEPVVDETGTTARQACYVTCLTGDENHNILHSP